MGDNDSRPILIAALIVGVCLLVGLTAAGYYVGRGTARFKSEAHTVTVKGLVEKEVKADEAVWTLSLRRASDDLRDVHTRVSADREAVNLFLHKQGFKESEITRQPIRTIDKLARDYGQPQANERLRYLVTTAVVVRTANIELVQKSLGSTEATLESRRDTRRRARRQRGQSTLHCIKIQRPPAAAARRGDQKRAHHRAAICRRLGRRGRQDSFGQSGIDPNLRQRRQRRVGTV